MDNRIEIRPGRIIHLTTYSHPSSNHTAFLIHGLGGSSKQWREQIPVLKEKYSLIIADLLGHGQSDKPVSRSTNLYSFGEFILDWQVIFDRYASTQNIILGHSYGGALAAGLAFDHQDNVNQLVLFSPLALAPATKIPFVYSLPSTILEWLRPLLEKDFLRLAFDPSADSSLVAEEAKASRANPMHVIKSMIQGMKTFPLLDASKLSTSTWMILGEHDGIVPPDVSKQFYKTLPHHQIEMIANAAHMTLLEKPREVNDIIQKI